MLPRQKKKQTNKQIRFVRVCKIARMESLLVCCSEQSVIGGLYEEEESLAFCVMVENKRTKNSYSPQAPYVIASLCKTVFFASAGACAFCPSSLAVHVCDFYGDTQMEKASISPAR